MLATKANHVACVQELFDKGASVLLKTHSGRHVEEFTKNIDILSMISMAKLGYYSKWFWMVQKEQLQLKKKPKRHSKFTKRI